MCLLVNLFILSKEDYTYLGIILYYIFVLLDHVFYVYLAWAEGGPTPCCPQAEVLQSLETKPGKGMSFRSSHFPDHFPQLN